MKEAGRDISPELSQDFRKNLGKAIVVCRTLAELNQTGLREKAQLKNRAGLCELEKGRVISVISPMLIAVSKALGFQLSELVWLAENWGEPEPSQVSETIRLIQATSAEVKE